MVREATSGREVKSIELPTGVTLQYVEQGEPSGVPMLLLPGACDSWRSYELVLPHLPGSIRAFALTQRGHGDSSKPETGYRFHDFAADLAAFMDALRLEAAVIVGHSLSTLIAQRFAIDYPGRTLGVVLAGALVSPANNPSLRELVDVVSKMEDPVDEGFVRELQSTIQPVPQEFIETMVQECLKFPARAWRGASESALADELSGELHKIAVPTLVIWGDQDALSSRSSQEALTEAISHSGLVVYEGASHSVHWEEPERFASDLASFLKTITQ